MERVHIATCHRLVLLLAFLTTAFGSPQPVQAGVDHQDRTNPLIVYLMTPDIPKTLCTGERKVLEYAFYYMEGVGRPPLIPALGLSAEAALSAGSGTVFPTKRTHIKVLLGKTYTGEFSYTAGKEAGSDTILIAVSIAGMHFRFPLSFEIIHCKASLQFSQQMTFSYEMVSVITTYSGSGMIGINKDGQIAGSGSQAVWSDIPPYTEDGGSCTHNSPWGGSSGIEFSGQIGTNGNTDVTMALQALTVNASTLTCTGGDHSGSMPFPGYTYAACQVPLNNFRFDAGTLEIPFNCPGEEPYTVSITVIPRSEK